MGLECLRGDITTDELLGYHLPAIRAWILRVLGVEPIGKVHPAIRNAPLHQYDHLDHQCALTFQLPVKIELPLGVSNDNY